MAYVKLTSLVVFLLATFCMFATKNVAAVTCSGACSPFETKPCGSTKDCRCIPVGLVVGYCTYPSAVVMKRVEEHPSLCQSHADCTKKGTGSFCARYPNSDIEYGWCFASNTEAEFFFKTSSNYKFTKDYLKNTAIA
ncbi:albumin-1 [Trifolium repens]|nr:albumin-1 [Trifolium repens]